jgi:hypothetical protein
MAPHNSTDESNTDRVLDTIAIELEAMQAIATALAAVRDPQARQRVLQWANERFNADPALLASPHRPNAAEPADDPSLAVEPLYEFFEAPRAAARVPATRETVIEPALADRRIPQPFAASAAPEVPPRESRAVREEPALDTLVRGFASDFQRLAVEWQTA